MSPKKADKTSWWPTRKWAVSTFGGIITVLTLWVTSGNWNQEENLLVLTLASTAFGTYMIPNSAKNQDSP